jgi:hypothetical protein
MIYQCPDCVDPFMEHQRQRSGLSFKGQPYTTSGHVVLVQALTVMLKMRGDQRRAQVTR